MSAPSPSRPAQVPPDPDTPEARPEAARPRRPTRRLVLQGLVGLAVSAFFIWLTLRGRDLSVVGEAFLVADWRLVAVCLGVLLAVHLVRTLRWGILLAPLARIPLGPLNRACAVGFMALALLPMRLGELARPWLVSRPDPARGGRAPVSMSAATGSVVFERLADGVFVSAALVALLAAVPADHGAEAMWMKRAALLLLAAFVSVATLAWWFHRRREAAARFAGRIGAVLGEGGRRRVMDVTGRLAGGLIGPKDRGAWIRFAALTLAYWTAAAGGLLVLARAFDLVLTPWQAATVLGVQVVGAMIPAGPGMLGTFQYFSVLGVSLFAAGEGAEGRAVAFAHLMWALQFGQQVILGLLFLPRRERVLSRLAAGEVQASD